MTKGVTMPAIVKRTPFPHVTRRKVSNESNDESQDAKTESCGSINGGSMKKFLFDSSVKACACNLQDNDILRA